MESIPLTQSHRRDRMRTFWYIAGLTLLFFLFLFGLSVGLGLSLDASSERMIGVGGALGILASIGLLTADVILPIPASIIMLANGALYGPVLGAVVSLIGGLGAVLLGYFLGRQGEQVVSRWMGPAERKQARQFFERWGVLAVAVSRPVPLLSETVAVMAGLSGWKLGRTLFSGLAGLLPVVIIYAWSGAFAVQKDFGLLTFLLVIGIGFLAWIIGRRLNPDTPNSSAGVEG